MKKRTNNHSPTAETYDELQLAYSHFNAALFGEQLPDCIITLQREKHTAGYFSSKRFVRRDGKTTDEIALNPSYFGIVPIIEILQTLVHEQAHLWQQHFGAPGRRRYHNVEWANKMESIGLMPSSTGAPGGKRTGEKMADFPISGGSFVKACEDLMTQDFTISWFDRFPARAPQITNLIEEIKEGSELENEDAISLLYAKPEVCIEHLLTTIDRQQTRSKYYCSNCEISLWGKKDLSIICGNCKSTFEPT